jgi:Protein of unknown function (DUF2934)
MEETKRTSTRGRRSTSDDVGARSLGEPSSFDARAADTAIARRAYELYESRGGEHGHDLEDWLQAETEVRKGRASST